METYEDKGDHKMSDHDIKMELARLRDRISEMEELLNTVDSRSSENEESINGLPSDLWDIGDIDSAIENHIDGLDLPDLSKIEDFIDESTIDDKIDDAITNHYQNAHMMEGDE